MCPSPLSSQTISYSRLPACTYPRDGPPEPYHTTQPYAVNIVYDLFLLWGLIGEQAASQVLAGAPGGDLIDGYPRLLHLVEHSRQAEEKEEVPMESKYAGYFFNFLGEQPKRE